MGCLMLESGTNPQLGLLGAPCTAIPLPDLLMAQVLIDRPRHREGSQMAGSKGPCRRGKHDRAYPG